VVVSAEPEIQGICLLQTAVDSATGICDEPAELTRHANQEPNHSSVSNLENCQDLQLKCFEFQIL
jgi:hypothetical protein